MWLISLMSIHLRVQPRTMWKLLMHLAIGCTLTKMPFTYFMVSNIITLKEIDQCSKKLCVWNVLKVCMLVPDVPFYDFTIYGLYLHFISVDRNQYKSNWQLCDTTSMVALCCGMPSEGSTILAPEETLVSCTKNPCLPVPWFKSSCSCHALCCNNVNIPALLLITRTSMVDLLSKKYPSFYTSFWYQCFTSSLPMEMNIFFFFTYSSPFS